jgi:hypothetical protein
MEHLSVELKNGVQLKGRNYVPSVQADLRDHNILLQKVLGVPKYEVTMELLNEMGGTPYYWDYYDNQNNTIAGSCAMFSIPDYFYTEHSYLFMDTAVDVNYRNTGLWKHMVQERLKLMKKLEASINRIVPMIIESEYTNTDWMPGRLDNMVLADSDFRIPDPECDKDKNALGSLLMSSTYLVQNPMNGNVFIEEGNYGIDKTVQIRRMSFPLNERSSVKEVLNILNMYQIPCVEIGDMQGVSFGASHQELEQSGIWHRILYEMGINSLEYQRAYTFTQPNIKLVYLYEPKV